MATKNFDENDAKIKNREKTWIEKLADYDGVASWVERIVSWGVWIKAMIISASTLASAGIAKLEAASLSSIITVGLLVLSAFAIFLSLVWRIQAELRIRSADRLVSEGKASCETRLKTEKAEAAEKVEQAEARVVAAVSVSEEVKKKAESTDRAMEIARTAFLCGQGITPESVFVKIRAKTARVEFYLRNYGVLCGEIQSIIIRKVTVGFTSVYSQPLSLHLGANGGRFDFSGQVAAYIDSKELRNALESASQPLLNVNLDDVQVTFREDGKAGPATITINRIVAHVMNEENERDA